MRRRGDLTVHLFSKGRGSVAVAWSDYERRLTIEDAGVLDLMGNPLKKAELRPGEPVFIVAPRLNAEPLDARLQ